MRGQITKQQSEIAKHKPDGLLKVIAYAGTGKTSSLVALAQNQSDQGKRGLYLAFNKSSCNDARSRFPSTVTCSTIHALAFRAVGTKYKHKLQELKVIDVIRHMGLDYDWVFADWVLKTIRAWTVSDKIEFPKVAIDLNGPIGGDFKKTQYAALIAQRLWEKMIEPSSDAPLSHDGYLKLFQISDPRISTDFLMLDEAQDTNPVTWDIVRRQTCPIIIVGDRYQSIYEFRGAVNAMDQANANKVLPLTQSFRFGTNLARVANALLWGFFEEPMELEGCGLTTHVGTFPSSIPHAVIARTNATVFSEAISSMRHGKSIGFVGGVNSYGFNSFVDCWHLCNGENTLVRDRFLRGFDDFNQLFEYSEASNDLDVKRMIEVVKNYGSTIPEIVSAIHAASLPSLNGADIILSTAHKCKGLTLDYVRLANDFPELTDSDDNSKIKKKLNKQEVNLIYVAATRASKALTLNYATNQFLADVGVDVNSLEAKDTIVTTYLNAAIAPSKIDQVAQKITNESNNQIKKTTSRSMDMFNIAKRQIRQEPSKVPAQIELF